MCDLSFPFVRDLIILTVPLLLTSLLISLMKRVLTCNVPRPRFNVSRETKKSVKSWCYDENEI